MFEDSTFDSTKRIHTRSRRWMIATFAFNAAILLALILIPLFNPEALSGKAITILMTAPPMPVEQPRPVVRLERAPAVSSEMQPEILRAPSIIPRDPPSAIEPPDSNINVSVLLPDGGGPGGPGGVLHGTGTSPVIVRVPVGPRLISSGVAVGMLIHQVLPHYPPIALTARMEGTVVLQAAISKSGTIENLRVVSGPATLQQAALDAVKQWQYRPYLLNGEPVEVETTVNVDFKLN